MNPEKGCIGSSRVIQRRWLSIKSGGELQCIGGEVHGCHRDYVVTKIPRFAFEKFPQADPTLTTQMKSVGDAMAIGRTFKEGEHTRLACRFRRPRRNHIRPTSDSASEALDRSTRGRVRSPMRSLEIGRTGLGGDGKPWRIGEELKQVVTNCDLEREKCLRPATRPRRPCATFPTVSRFSRAASGHHPFTSDMRKPSPHWSW